MIALDTNLLVYAHRRGLPEHGAARRAIETACNDPRGAGLSLPNITEFWSVVTHAANPRPSSPAQASAFLEALAAEGGLVTFGMEQSLPGRLRRLAAEMGIVGPRIFDLQIALIALDAGAQEIWTHDAGFIRIPGLRVRDPLKER